MNFSQALGQYEVGRKTNSKARIKMNEALPVDCQHANTMPSYDHVKCKDCGWFKTDNGREWGDNADKWFKRLPHCE